MRRWVVKSFGEPKDVWMLQDHAETLEPGPGQVKVKVEACGLGLPDVLMSRDNYPLTPSQEVAGEVIATHLDLVKHWQEGVIDLSKSEVFDFDDALTAATHIADGKVEGKFTVQINEK